MTVYGDQGKGEIVWDTATDSKGRNASCNALHTIWDAKFKNKGAHVIHNKDLAILNFALTEVNYLSIMFNFYRTRVRSLFTLVSNSLTH